MMEGVAVKVLAQKGVTGRAGREHAEIAGKTAPFGEMVC